jgi:hypothetical protein
MPLGDNQAQRGNTQKNFEISESAENGERWHVQIPLDELSIPHPRGTSIPFV